MKKLTFIILGTMIAGSASLAATNVLSRNAVGYIKINLVSNNLVFLSNPFVNLEPTDEASRITNVLASLPNRTTVSIWNESGQRYVDFLKDARGNWTGTGVSTAKLDRADGFFLRTLGNGDLYFMGEVPDKYTYPSNYVSRTAGITMTSYPYPVTVLLTQTVMAAALPNSSVVSIWNEDSQSYQDAIKDARGNWSQASGFTLHPGRGLIINSTAAGNTWYEPKPYTWP